MSVCRAEQSQAFMDAIITYADGSQEEVENLPEFASQFINADDFEGTESLVRALFQAEPEIAEVVLDPEGEALYLFPQHDDFAIGFGL
jgi:hypothetical protein